jgi:hypothetical protein
LENAIVNRRVALVPVLLAPVAIGITSRAELSDFASGSVIGIVLGLAVLGLVVSRRGSRAI